VSRIAAIALGSNLASPRGDREANLREAIARVAKLGEVRAVSSFHDTAPVGYADQPNFLNGAMLLETELEPVELMRALLAIERAMGRDRAAVVTDAAQSGAAPIKGPRIIDLDLLLMDDVVLASARGMKDRTELTLPHPAMTERRFVLEPLAEIAPAMADPISGCTVAQLLARLNQP
jgi:2-amino-4-hydroxy-6-hydroxymethyldihydropteridine diphosphokinase